MLIAQLDIVANYRLSNEQKAKAKRTCIFFFFLTINFHVARDTASIEAIGPIRKSEAFER